MVDRTFGAALLQCTTCIDQKNVSRRLKAKVQLLNGDASSYELLPEVPLAGEETCLVE